jgi:hypothetical protein
LNFQKSILVLLGPWLLALSGCASSGQQVTVPIATAAAVNQDPFKQSAPDAKNTALVFASNQYNQVLGYSQKTGALVETLTGFNEVDGLATDQSGSLYVPSQRQHEVFVYPYGSTTPSLTLNDKRKNPLKVAVSRKGEVCVPSAVDVGSGVFSISFFKKGAPTPFRTMRAPFLAITRDCAYDAAGNTYVTGFNNQLVGEVGYIAGGGEGARIVNLGITSVAQPSGLQVATNGDVLVGDQEAATIHEFQPDSNNEVGRVLLDRNIVLFALTKDNKHVWATDNSDAFVSEFAFPGGGTPVKNISASSPIGIAVTPWAQP